MRQDEADFHMGLLLMTPPVAGWVLASVEGTTDENAGLASLR